MKRHFRKWGIALCAVLTAVLIGCQAVGGLDLDQAFLTQLDVTSKEESGALSVKIDWKQEQLESIDPQIARLAELFSQVDLRIENASTDGEGRSLMTGSIGLAGKSPVGFKMHADGWQIRLDVDGAKRPLFIDLAELSGGEQLPDARTFLGDGMQQQMKEMIRPVAAHFLKHLPNPEQLDVSRVVSDVNGVPTSLTKVHAAFDGEQLGELLETYVQALAQDEAGIRAVLGEVAQWTAALPPELLSQLSGEDTVPMPSPEELEEAMELGVQLIVPALQQLEAEIADLKQQPEWVLIFDQGITFKTDLYVDDRLQIRKSDTELVLQPVVFRMAESPVNSIAIRYQQEIWNVNGKVEIPPVDKPLRAIGPERLEKLSPVQFVRLFEDDSAIHDILKNELQIDDSRFELGGWYGDELSPYLAGDGENERLYVPLRQVLEQLDDPVSFTPETGELRFYDPGTWQEFIMRVGSAEMTVNGEQGTLSGPIELRNDFSFVPAEDLFRLLQAQYTYEQDEDGLITVTVTRDL